jgi:uncharacterized protein
MDPLPASVQTLLAEAPIGFLGMAGPQGPYVLPVSFAYETGRAYLHGGPGRKADLLTSDPRVCLSVASEVELTRGADACGDNFRYRSALVFGRMRLLEDDQEREAALRAIARKYDPAAAEQEFRPEMLARTLVYVLDAAEVTFKEN